MALRPAVARGAGYQQAGGCQEKAGGDDPCRVQLGGAEEAGNVAGDVRGWVVQGGEGPAEQFDGCEAGEGLARKPPARPQQAPQQPDHQHCSGTGYGHEDLLRGGQAAKDVHAEPDARDDEFGHGGAAAESRQDVTESVDHDSRRQAGQYHQGGGTAAQGASSHDARAGFQRRLTD